jgi:hypothetical protein
LHRPSVRLAPPICQACTAHLCAPRLTRPCRCAQVLYNTLVDVGATSELLSLDTTDLEAFLAREGGMEGGPVAADRIPALRRRQVQLLELLARRHISRSR